MDTITKDLGWAIARLSCLKDGKGEHLELVTPIERTDSGEAIPAQSINLPEEHLIALVELLREGKLIEGPISLPTIREDAFAPPPPITSMTEPITLYQRTDIKDEWKRVHGEDEASAIDTMAAITGKRTVDALTKWDAKLYLDTIAQLPDLADSIPAPDGVTSEQIKLIAVLWNQKFHDAAGGGKAREHLDFTTSKKSRKDLAKAEASEYIETLIALPDCDSWKASNPPASKESKAAILTEWNRLYGDVLTDTAAKEQAQCHLRVQTGKLKRSELTEPEAAKYLAILRTMTHETLVKN